MPTLRAVQDTVADDPRDPAVDLPHVTGEFDEQTRKAFLMTHGQQFISSRRAHRAFRRAQSHKKMNYIDEEAGKEKEG